MEDGWRKKSTFLRETCALAWGCKCTPPCLWKNIKMCLLPVSEDGTSNSHVSTVMTKELGFDFGLTWWTRTRIMLTQTHHNARARISKYEVKKATWARARKGDPPHRAASSLPAFRTLRTADRSAFKCKNSVNGYYRHIVVVVEVAARKGNSA